MVDVFVSSVLFFFVLIIVVLMNRVEHFYIYIYIYIFWYLDEFICISTDFIKFKINNYVNFKF